MFIVHYKFFILFLFCGPPFGLILCIWRQISTPVSRRFIDCWFDFHQTSLLERRAVQKKMKNSKGQWQNWMKYEKRKIIRKSWEKSARYQKVKNRRYTKFTECFRTEKKYYNTVKRYFENVTPFLFILFFRNNWWKICALNSFFVL